MSIFEIEKGVKRQKCIPGPGFDTALPVTVLRGYLDEPCVTITAGIHNEEYVGIETANRLALELDPARIRGAVAIIHMCNPTGFAALSRDVVPEDGKNLNRVFPGGADSEPSHRLAHFITEDFLKPASLHIDLHCGGGREELTPHVYFQAMAGSELEKASLQLALLMDADWAVASKSLSGSAFSHASQYAVPSILMERGGMAEWSGDEVRAYLADVRRMRTAPAFSTRASRNAGFRGGSTAANIILLRQTAAGTARTRPARSCAVAICSERSAIPSDSVGLYQLGSFSVREGESLVAGGII